MLEEQYRYLCKAYSKPFDYETFEIYNLNVKHNKKGREPYKKSNFDIGIKWCIKHNAFFPTVAELIKGCEMGYREQLRTLAEKIYKNGRLTFFEFEKTLHFIDEGNIPSWMKEMFINEYSQLQLSNDTKMLEG